MSGNEILMSFMGHNSVKILQKITGNNPKLGFVNVDVHRVNPVYSPTFPKRGYNKSIPEKLNCIFVPYF